MAAKSVSPETLIAIKADYDGCTRRFKLALKDLGATTFTQKIRDILAIENEDDLVLKRFSDSAERWIQLDTEDPAVYKQLYRAAKAKGKLRIKVLRDYTQHHAPEVNADVEPPKSDSTPLNESTPFSTETHPPRGSYLNTVLNDDPLPTIVENDPAKLSRHDCFLAFRGAPVDCSYAAPGHWVPQVDDESPSKVSKYYIDCNNCGSFIPNANAHWHCSICENGDYDLCEECIHRGVLCLSDKHWLIKRSVVDGAIVCSTTETLAPVPDSPAEQAPVRSEEQVQKTAEAAKDPVPKPENDYDPHDIRTCNACFRELHKSMVAFCIDCSDYDLCFACMDLNEHGHHPGHTFTFITNKNEPGKFSVSTIRGPGRGVVHTALCDGCDNKIVGIRHKCLDCPDFDLCSECVLDASLTHKRHRFVPIYTPIELAPTDQQVHTGVRCDGPLCKAHASRYITGLRYKCAICHDVDFCASCEAHPNNTHNRTHPLLMFKTSVRHVSISTYGEDDSGTVVQTMGDTTTSRPGELPRVAHASTQVQKSSDLPKPPTLKTPPVETKEKITPPVTAELQAHFVRDSVADGTELYPTTVFSQTWTLRNPGPLTWAEGCRLHFAGGDNMFNIDSNSPSSTASLLEAMASCRLSAPVKPNESADFSLMLKAPDRVGRAISYWRLKTPEGLPFGDRLWCDIVVKAVPPSPKVEKPATPAVPEDGKGAMVFPTLENESPEVVDSASSPGTMVNDDEEQDLDWVQDGESVTMDEGQGSDGFLTDEEYDILDASDEEFFDSVRKSEKK